MHVLTQPFVLELVACFLYRSRGPGASPYRLIGWVYRPMAFHATSHDVQTQSDAHWDGVCWQYASWKSGMPTLIFDPTRNRRCTSRCQARVFIAPLDAVLDEKWLDLVQVNRMNGHQMYRPFCRRSDRPNYRPTLRYISVISGGSALAALAPDIALA